MSSADTEFKIKLAVFQWLEGTIRFPIDKPSPIRLITKIVKFRVTENLQKAKIEIEIIYIKMNCSHNLDTGLFINFL